MERSRIIGFESEREGEFQDQQRRCAEKQEQIASIAMKETLRDEACKRGNDPAHQRAENGDMPKAGVLHMIDVRKSRSLKGQKRPMGPHEQGWENQKEREKAVIRQRIRDLARFVKPSRHKETKNPKSKKQHEGRGGQDPHGLKIALVMGNEKRGGENGDRGNKGRQKQG